MIRCLTSMSCLVLSCIVLLCISTAGASAQNSTSALPDTLFKFGQAQIILPGRVCPGSDFLAKVEIYNNDTSEVEVTLRPNATPPFSKQYVRTNNGKADIWITAPPTNGSYQFVQIEIVIRDVSQTQAVPVDTHSGLVNVMDMCCDNTVINSNFMTVNASSGPCFPVDFATEMNFTLAVPCLGVIANVGEVSSGSRAVFGRPEWEALSHSADGSHMVYGDPVPNTKRKAWWQTEPVYGGRAFAVSAWVRNVEKLPRAASPLTNLRMMLVATQGPRVDTLDVQEFLQYDADPNVAWKQLTGTYVPVDDGDMELSVVVECVTPQAVGYGFAIDDIRFEPVRIPVNAGSNGQICGGQGGAQLNPIVPPGHIAYWRPANGLVDTLDLAPVVSPTVTTTYVLIVRDTFNCLDSGQVTITVLTADSMSISAVDTVLCGGDSVVLRAEPGLASYQWFMNSFPFGGNTDTLVATLPGVYTLQSTSPGGCPLTSNTIVVYQQQPSVLRTVLDTAGLPKPLRIGTVVDIPIIVTRTLPPGSPQLPIATDVYVTYHSSTLYPLAGFDTYNPSQIRVRVDSLIESDTVVVSWVVALGQRDEAVISLLTKTPPGNCTSDTTTAAVSIPIEICRANGDRLVFAGDPLVILNMYPQPGAEDVTVEAYCLERGSTQLDVVSATGERMWQTSIDVDASGLYTFVVPTRALSSGSYQVILRGPYTTTRSVMRVVH